MLQVYVINVTWSDGSVNVIYRRYSKFFDLQVSREINSQELYPLADNFSVGFKVDERLLDLILTKTSKTKR